MINGGSGIIAKYKVKDFIFQIFKKWDMAK